MHTTEIGRDRLQGSGCVLVDRGNHSKTVPSAYAGLDEFFVEWYHIDLWWQRKYFWTILQRRIIIFENHAQTKDISSKWNQTEWDVDRLLDLSSLSRFVGTHNIAIERFNTIASWSNKMRNESFTDDDTNEVESMNFLKFVFFNRFAYKMIDI